jgi:hypothetical protein
LKKKRKAMPINDMDDEDKYEAHLEDNDVPIIS